MQIQWITRKEAEKMFSVQSVPDIEKVKFNIDVSLLSKHKKPVCCGTLIEYMDK